MKEMVGGCCVCSDERGWPDNPLVYCDGNGCTVAVHQACYGIVTVPTGPWYCRKCEGSDTKGKVRCELCPSKSGALKRTDNGGWAHVVCALYIPEVRFGNVTSMEPIVLRLIPPERYNKQCYICQESHKSHRATIGACMQCNKSGCKQQFHVTCAQSLGLLCEEAGNYLDNVKYCGYCQHHYSKLKKGGNVKTIPPYKPVSHDSHSSDSSGEKEGGASPMAGGGTPTHHNKNKGPGRKSSHSSSGSAAKNTPNSGKTATTNASQPMETNQEATEAEPPVAPAPVPVPIPAPAPSTGRKHKGADKNKKKPSPARRGSSAGDTGSGSKGSTPAPSPQHSTDSAQGQPAKAAGGSTPGGNSKVPPESPSPTSKSATEEGAKNAPPAPENNPEPTPSTSKTAATVPLSPETPVAQYGSVIIRTKDCKPVTKKRKAASAANAANAVVDFGAAPPKAPNATDTAQNTANNNNNAWEQTASNDVQMRDESDKVKKAKTDIEPLQAPSPFSILSPAAPLPPPPPHSPAPQRSPRQRLPSPMPGPSMPGPMPGPVPGPSGTNPNIVVSVTPPSDPPGGKGDPISLLVPLPLLPSGQRPGIPALQKPSESSTYVFPPPHNQATTQSNFPTYSPHQVPVRSSWGGLNVAYEMQQDPNKPGVSGVNAPSGANKEGPNLSNIPIPPAPVRNKKRAAMSAMANMTPPPPGPQASPSLTNVRRQPQQTPPPIHQETIRDSPPSSPSSDRPLKPKMETKIGASCTAPHMLGNELNPDSGAAARLQEQLTAELAAHAAGAATQDVLVPPPLINKAQSACGSRSGSGGSAQSLDQLLERQWEQGSQFLMEQAQHFDIASLLSCLHQLRTENVRLEEHVGSLLQRRDHLLAVNARLAIPLTTVSTGPPEPSRCPRENGAPVRPPHAPMPRPAETVTSERHQLMMREVQQKPS